MFNKLNAIFLGLSLAVLADSIAPVTPKNGATLSMLKPEQQIFCQLTEQGGRKILADPALAAYFASEVKSFPKGVELGWIFTGVRSQVRFEVTLADNEAFENARVLPAEVISP